MSLAIVLTASCTGASRDGQPSAETAPTDTRTGPAGDGVFAPIAPEDRAPIPERRNALNLDPPVPADATFPEFEALRKNYLIPEEVTVAEGAVRDAAFAFGSMLLAAFRDPTPAASNVDLPGLASPLPLPASLNMLGRAALHRRSGASGVDVGPSRPDKDGRLWVAVFQGASGPIGAVEAVCSGVTVRAINGAAVIEVITIEARLLRQPKDREDFPVVLCQVDLETTPQEGFQPAA